MELDFLLRGFLDALPFSTAILDATGRITAVNEQWRRFARENGVEALPSVDAGINYLDVCRRSAASGDPWAGKTLEGLQSILDRRVAHFTLEYPCHSPSEKRWFALTAAAFGENVAVLHQDITGRKLAEEALQASHDTLEQQVKERTIGLSEANQCLKMEIAERQKAEDQLRQALAEIEIYKSQLEAECSYLQEEINLEHNFAEIIGQSDALKYALFKVSQVAPTKTTVLVLGETGTGKELLARAIHSASSRSARLLVKVNCAALPAHLLESELFGHEKGAFTGAWARQLGRFELANGGTIFLDEIGELPLELQSKLLRVLQDKEFERVGNPRTITADVRVIAATNRDLEKEVREGRFRQDLWYRINVFPITAPPLRQRAEDIPLLARAFTARCCKKIGKKNMTVPQRVVDALRAYSWPGNIRELENVIERAVISSTGPVLHLAESLAASKPARDQSEAVQNLEAVERAHILSILDRTRWRIEGDSGAASILGLNPSTLRGRLRKLGIERPWK